MFPTMTFRSTRIEGAARKHATTVGTLDLLLGIVGRIGGDWQLDPCRTLTVQPENRVLMVGPENRTRTIGPETRVLVVAC